MFISRDVRFIENVFPYKDLSPQVLFPASPHYVDDDPLLMLYSIESETVTDQVNIENVKPETSESVLCDSFSNLQPVPSSAPQPNIDSNDQVPTVVTSDKVLSDRPKRIRHIPSKLLDYTGLPAHLVSNIDTTATVLNHTNDSSQAADKFMPSISSIEEPQTYKQAVQFEEWCQAMTIELAASCRLLYKVKYHVNGQIDRYKARLVAKGFTQTTNMDYFETFAPVAKMTSFRLLLSLAAMNQWKISQLDVTNAFLHGTLDEEVYMTLPLGYIVPDAIKSKYPNQKIVCRLLKSLYGLKQAPRQWFIALSIAPLSFGFLQTHGDPSLFVYSQGSNLVYLFIYVDDMVMTGNNADLMTHITEFLGSQFKIKDLGALHYFLGFQVQHSTQGILMHQTKYLAGILDEFQHLSSKFSLLPMDQHHDLLQESDSLFLIDATAYRRLIGRFIYLTISRPDLAYPVHVLAQYMTKPRSIHRHAVLKLIRYLFTTGTQGLFYNAAVNPDLTAYCDADWGSCKLTRQSLTGYCVLFGNTVISWNCKKQQTMSRSSAEAEYRSIVDVCYELSWLISLCAELHLKHLTHVPLFCDNQSALYISHNPVFHERTKHIEIDCHLVRQKLKTGLICPQHISTHEQPADLFTKALSSAQLLHFLSKLAVVQSSSPLQLEGDVSQPFHG